MDSSNQISPVTRTYCVWADWNRRVYQYVEATSPTEAFRTAKEHPGDWELCFGYEDNGYRLSTDVQDAETEENFTVGEVGHCKACGSEIVATVNGSNFNDGECGGCEYSRYHSQPALLAACKGVSGMIFRDKNDDECIDLDQYEQAERACRSAITQAEHGNAA